MKVKKATKKVQDLLDELARAGDLVDVYSKSFFDRQPSVKTDPYALFSQEGFQYVLDEYENNIESEEKPLGHLLFIHVNGLNAEMRKTLIEVYKPLKNLIDAGKHNPDFIIINIFTKQLLCIGLGRKNRLFAIDAASGEGINAFNLIGGSRDGEDAAYMDRFTKHDIYECVSDLVHALHKLGLAMYNYDSTIANQDQLEHTLDSGPNQLGVYQLKSFEGEILDDEEYSKEEVIQLLEEIIEYQKEEDDSMKVINIFFPQCYQGDLNTGDY